MTPEEKMQDAADALQALLNERKQSYTVGEHIIAAERLLCTYKQLFAAQSEWAAAHDTTIDGEGGLDVIRYVIEMHTALAAVRASL